LISDPVSLSLPLRHVLGGCLEVVVAEEPLPEFKLCINWFKRFVD